MSQRAPRHIALIGLSGSGKSTLAPLLAATLGWPLADSDAQISATTGLSAAAFFAAHGEVAFRDCESAVLTALLAAPTPTVIATGGGIVLREANRTLLKAHAHLIWLDLPDADILARLAASNEARPLLSSDGPQRLAAMRLARAPLYRELADLIVPASEPPAELVAAICAWLATLNT